MSRRMHVATRKGLFTYEASGNGDWELERTAFLGDPVTVMLEDPRDGRLYAALNLGHFGVKIHASDDHGKNWEEIGVPAYPESGPDDEKAASLVQVWELTPGGADQPGWIWAGTIPGGLFLSKDRGLNWELVETLWNREERQNWVGGGYDDPGIHSICVDPRDSAHITVGVSVGGVWRTHDSGKTWACDITGMYAEYMPPERREDPTVQDPHRVVQSPTAPDRFWVQHHNGVFHSADGAKSWTDIPMDPSKFGFAVAVHPTDPDTAWFVPAVKDECRVPVDGKVVVTRTRDGGKSFDVLRNGLPQEHAYDLVFRHALDVDETGSCLAFGSTTGNLWVSDNGGDCWRLLSANLPPIHQVRLV